MPEEIKKKFTINCRAVIIHEGKILSVRLPHDTSYVCLPGGRLNWNEDIKDCLTREIIEELGVRPEIGRLLYVLTFMEKEKHTVGFFFEVINGKDYLNCEKLDRTHSNEITEMIWVGPTDDIRLLPQKFAEDFRSGKIGTSDEVQFIRD